MEMFENLRYLIRNVKKPTFKIGFISYYYPTENNFTNGVAVHLYYLSRKLAERGCEVHVFTHSDKNFIKEEYICEGKLIIHGIDIGFKGVVGDDVIKKRMRYLLFDNKVILEITSENNKRKFDIIHTHGWLTAGAFVSRMFNNIHWVHTFHALEKARLKFMTSEEKKYFNLTHWIESNVHYADAVIAVSNYLKKDIIETLKIEGKYAFYIPNGIDFSLFNAHKAHKEKKIVFVGRFSLEKGIDIVAEISKKILERTSDVKIVIVSQGSSKIGSLQPLRKEFETLEAKYGGRFLWIKEPKNREFISQLYKSSMVCIQPSRYESFGLSVVEAMACGSVVISSNQGGLPEVVGKAGFVVALKSNEFVKRILRLLKDSQLRKNYIKKGLKQVNKYDWDSVADKTFELYRIIAKNKNYPIVEGYTF